MPRIFSNCRNLSSEIAQVRWQDDFCCYFQASFQFITRGAGLELVRFVKSLDMGILIGISQKAVEQLFSNDWLVSEFLQLVVVEIHGRVLYVDMQSPVRVTFRALQIR